MVKSISSLEETYNSGDIFFIDANVLIFLHCPINIKPDKAVVYSNFIQQLKNAGCPLCVSTMTLQEVFHAVEKLNGQILNSNMKSLRSNKSAREKLARTQRIIWNQINETYSIIDETIERKVLAQYINHYENHKYDPIDFLLASRPNLKIISDDKDFENDSNVTLYKA